MSELNQDVVVIAKNNNSLSPKGFIWLFASIVAITLTVALGVSVVGAWFVLPFAGLEILAFAWAFHVVILHYEDHDSITINGEHVIIKKHRYKQVEKFTFQRYWAKVILRSNQDGSHALMIGSHGKEVEFGQRFISEEQRLHIATRLRLQIKNND